MHFTPDTLSHLNIDTEGRDTNEIKLRFWSNEPLVLHVLPHIISSMENRMKHLSTNTKTYQYLLDICLLTLVFQFHGHLSHVTYIQFILTPQFDFQVIPPSFYQQFSFIVAFLLPYHDLFGFLSW